MALTSGQLEAERRRKAREVVIKDLSVCHNCSTKDLKEEDKFCPQCGFPQRGTQQQMRSFLFELKENEYLLKDMQQLQRRVRIILFVLAGLNALFALVYAFNDKDVVAAVIQLVVAALYGGFGLWSYKAPLPASICGFFLYIVIMVITAIAEPMSIFQGLLWKVLFIGGFIYGIRASIRITKLKEQLSLQKKEAVA